VTKNPAILLMPTPLGPVFGKLVAEVHGNRTFFNAIILY